MHDTQILLTLLHPVRLSRLKMRHRTLLPRLYLRFYQHVSLSLIKMMTDKISIHS